MRELHIIIIFIIYFLFTYNEELFDNISYCFDTVNNKLDIDTFAYNLALLMIDYYNINIVRVRKESTGENIGFYSDFDNWDLIKQETETNIATSAEDDADLDGNFDDSNIPASISSFWLTLSNLLGVHKFPYYMYLVYRYHNMYTYKGISYDKYMANVNYLISQTKLSIEEQNIINKELLKLPITVK